MSENIYAVGTFNFDIDSIVKRAEQQRFNEANQKRQDGSSFRDSKVTWINKWPELEGYATRLVKFVNNLLDPTVFRVIISDSLFLLGFFKIKFTSPPNCVPY